LLDKRREYRSRKADMSDGQANVADQRLAMVHQLTSLLITRVAILGPVERAKIIMQTKHMAQYANPRVDMPKNSFDLFTKVTLNQGVPSIFRGQSSLALMLVA
jgi:hypothetical protein